MFRKAVIALAMTGSIIGLSATGASALDCSNLSRPAPAQPASPLVTIPGEGTVWAVQGDWWFITFAPDTLFKDGVWDKVPPGTASSVPQLAALLGLPAGTVNGNYKAGQGFGLLDNAQAPCNANRQTQHGIQAGSNRCP
jgi:hypothetical protein